MRGVLVMPDRHASLALMTKDHMPSTLRFLLAARRCELHGLEGLARTCELVVLVSRLVHALQKERGYSILYLCRVQDRLLVTLAQLTQDAATIERDVRQFLDQLEPDAIRTSEKARLLNGIAYVLYRLEEMADVRRRVREQRMSVDEADTAFTRLISTLLAVVFEAADSALDSDVTRILVALLNVMQGKELSGQERACGVMGLTRGHLSSLQKTRLHALGASQRRCFDAFASFAGDDLLALWANVTQQEQPVQRMRELMLATETGHQVDAGLAELWFDLCTVRIDAMHTVETQLAQALARQCEKRIADTREELVDRRLLLGRFAEQASGASPGMVFSLQGRMVDEPSSDGVGGDMARSLLDIMRDQTLRMQRADEALQAARGALDERKQVERAKWLLVSRHGLTEQGAHERLQRAAMDGGVSMAEVARQILEHAGHRA